MSQFFQTFILNVAQRDPGRSWDNEVNWLEKYWLCSVEHLRICSFLSTV